MGPNCAGFACWSDFFPKKYKYTPMDIDILEAGEYVPDLGSIDIFPKQQEKKQKKTLWT